MEAVPLLLTKQFDYDYPDFFLGTGFTINNQNSNLYYTYKTNEKKSFDEIKVSNLLEL